MLCFYFALLFFTAELSIARLGGLFFRVVRDLRYIEFILDLH